MGCRQERGCCTAKGEIVKRDVERLIIIIICATALPVLAQRVLVFPFTQEHGFPSSRWIGTGLAVGLNEALDRGKIGFVPFESLQKLYDQEGLVSSPDFSLPAQVGLAHQLGVAYLVCGTYRVREGEIIVNLNVFNVSGDLKPMGKWQEREKLDRLLLITEALARHLFDTFKVPWKKVEQVPPAAFESYIRGRIVDDPMLKEVYFKRAVDLAPDYSDALCQLALVLKSEGKVSDAVSILNGLVSKRFPKAYLALATLGDIRLKEGKLKEAKTLYLRSLKSSENPAGHLGLARLFIYEGKYDMASKELLVVERFGTHLDEVEALRAELAKRESASKSVGKGVHSPIQRSKRQGEVKSP